MCMLKLQYNFILGIDATSTVTNDKIQCIALFVPEQAMGSQISDL